LDRIPGDRNYIRIRQIPSTKRVPIYRTPAHLVRERITKRLGNKISQLISPLLMGGAARSEDYETPGQPMQAFWKTNPKGGKFDRGRENPIPSALRDSRPSSTKRLFI
jgi:hypothetical protein